MDVLACACDHRLGGRIWLYGVLLNGAPPIVAASQPIVVCLASSGQEASSSQPSDLQLHLAWLLGKLAEDSVRDWTLNCWVRGGIFSNSVACASVLGQAALHVKEGAELVSRLRIKFFFELPSNGPQVIPLTGPRTSLDQCARQL